MYSHYIAHQIFEILSDKLPFLSYNYTYCWFYVSHLGVHFSKVMFLLYFHINDNDSFLHTAWTCLLHPNLVIATLTSMHLSFYYFWNQSLERQEMLSYTAQKMKFSIKNFFSKYDQIRSFHFLCRVMPIARCKNHILLKSF